MRAVSLDKNERKNKLACLLAWLALLVLCGHSQVRTQQAQVLLILVRKRKNRIEKKERKKERKKAPFKLALYFAHSAHFDKKKKALTTLDLQQKRSKSMAKTLQKKTVFMKKAVFID